MMKKTIFPALGFVGAVALVTSTSCSESRNGWTIEGNISGISDTTVYIERPSGPVAWVIVDSVKTDSDGSFSFTAKYPESETAKNFYRVRLGDKSAYFTVNGTERLSLTSAAADFGKRHRWTGNVAVAAFTTIDSLVNAAIDRVGAAKAADDADLLTSLGNIITGDTTCIVSYYAVTRLIDGKPIFNTSDRRKLGLLGAVANNYERRRPDDPLGQEVKSAYLEAKKRKRSNSGNTVEASLSGRPMIDFVRQDVNGKEQNLNTVLDRGGVTILNLSRYDSKGSALNTAALGQAYEKYKDRGLVIFQVGFEPNEAVWRQNAVRMPWTTVYNRPGDSAEILIAYNCDPVNGDPVSFVFNANGDLIARIADPAELEAQLSKLF